MSNSKEFHYPDLPDEIKRKRKELNLSLEQSVAKIKEVTGVEISRSTLQRIENHKQNPPFDTMFVIAYTLGIDMIGILRKLYFRNKIRPSTFDNTDEHLEDLKQTLMGFNLSYLEAIEIIKLHVEVRDKMNSITGKRVTKNITNKEK
ncbi:helix-turn-helix domain-containing protein [Fredinandcohnia humi]